LRGVTRLFVLVELGLRLAEVELRLVVLVAHLFQLDLQLGDLLLRALQRGRGLRVLRRRPLQLQAEALRVRRSLVLLAADLDQLGLGLSGRGEPRQRSASQGGNNTRRRRRAQPKSEKHVAGRNRTVICIRWERRKQIW
jgi:hypothetical protein